MTEKDENPEASTEKNQSEKEVEVMEEKVDEFDLKGCPKIIILGIEINILYHRAHIYSGYTEYSRPGTR